MRVIQQKDESFNNTLSPQVTSYLIDVYKVLIFLIASFFIGITIGNYTFPSFFHPIAHIFLVIAMFILIAATIFSEHNSYFFASLSALIMGLLISPIVLFSLLIDKSIVLIALTSSIIIFITLIINAIYFPIKEAFYLRSILFSFLNISIFLGIFNLFLMWEWIFVLRLYGGLILYMFFVIYDTNIMIQRAEIYCRDGKNRNYSEYQKMIILDAMNLFLDFVNIFMRLLAIIMKNRERKRN